MQRDYIDFHYVEPEQLGIHGRLLNWARYVRVQAPHWQAPIWRLGKSNSRQWHSPEAREDTDILDGHAMEKAVAALPEAHRDAIRWCYVWRTTPAQARRRLGVTSQGLQRLVCDGRTMLTNRAKRLSALTG
jgi:DNA-directed RNA polymerase specialized sigma24 family protein